MSFLKKSTEEKFADEKMRQLFTFIIRMYRNEKLNLPNTKYSRIVLDYCKIIDPEHKLPERELIDRLLQSRELRDEISALDEDTFVPDNVLLEYTDRYYTLLRSVLSSPDPKEYDAYEYQSQQLISVLSLKKLNVFRTYLKDRMDSDPTCPYFMKKVLLDLLQPKTLPTDKDENTAEEIMTLVCPSLKSSSPDVFRALVDSLKWRGSHDLQKTLEQVKRTPPDRRHIRGRESCVFIETDSSVHYIG